MSSDACRPAIAAHAVQHAEECGGQQRRHPVRDDERHVPERHEQRREDQRPATSESIRGDADDRRHHGAACQPHADHQSGFRDRQAFSAKVNGQDDTDQADGG